MNDPIFIDHSSIPDGYTVIQYGREFYSIREKQHRQWGPFKTLDKAIQRCIESYTYRRVYDPWMKPFNPNDIVEDFFDTCCYCDECKAVKLIQRELICSECNSKKHKLVRDNYGSKKELNSRFNSRVTLKM